MICVDGAGRQAPAGRRMIAQGASPGASARPLFSSPGGAAERMTFRPSGALCNKSCRFPRADALGYFLASFQDENRRTLHTPVGRQAERTAATFPQDRREHVHARGPVRAPTLDSPDTTHSSGAASILGASA